MKKMKRLLALLLSAMLVLSMTMVAFAAEGGEGSVNEENTIVSGTIDDTPGSITINNINLSNNKPEATYKLYRIMDLYSFNFTAGAYSYKPAEDWEEFVDSAQDDAGVKYFSANSLGYYDWNGSKDAARVEKFAKKALEYAKEYNISPIVDTLENVGTDGEFNGTFDYEKSSESSIVFKGLRLGYYLVDSDVGALCGLSTTNPDGLINSKNGVPTIEKQVKEDLDGSWGDENNADIGQIVEYRAIIHVHDGAQNYVFHDVMSKGLTFDSSSVKVGFYDGSVSNATEEIVDPDNYTVVTDSSKSHTDCTFEIVFDEDYCDSLETNDRLFIYYNAMLNRYADIGPAGEGGFKNPNEAWMEYGENHFTSHDKTSTETYSIDLVKTDGQNKLLDGASFRIYDSEDKGNGKEIRVVPLMVTGSDGKDVQVFTDDGYAMYRLARKDINGNYQEDGVEIVVGNGMIRIIGFDNGKYWLEEIKHPDGYNGLESRIPFTIADANIDAIVTGGILSTNSGVQIINQSGSMLPETGAGGTMMFITFGMIVVLGTGVLLVTKKRMGMIQE